MEFFLSFFIQHTKWKNSLEVLFLSSFLCSFLLCLVEVVALQLSNRIHWSFCLTFPAIGLHFLIPDRYTHNIETAMWSYNWSNGYAILEKH